MRVMAGGARLSALVALLLLFAVSSQHEGEVFYSLHQCSLAATTCSCSYLQVAVLVLLLTTPCLTHRLSCGGLYAVLAQETCKEDVMGHSSIIGSKQQGAVMVDHSSLAAKGPITRVSLYYSKDKGCLKAAKAAFGDPPSPGVIGSTAGTTERWLKLEAGEVIIKAEYKAGK